jgi:hypothetical protein
MRARVSISEKIGRIVQEIDLRGNASLTRLTVLKKWLEPSGRLPALGAWIARRAAFDHEGKETAEKALLAKARAFFEGVPTDANSWSAGDRRSAEAIHQQAWNYKREFRGQQWGPVRVVHSWPLLLIESGLALVLDHDPHPADGYKLASDWAQNFDGRYGNGFNGPSREKLVELAKWTEENEK